MVAYSFQKQFAEPILAGTKCQTIRAVGKRRHARVGDELQLYTGMRTKHCRLVGRAECALVSKITIWLSSVRINRVVILPEDDIPRSLGPWGLDRFAKLDGFGSAGEMWRFWNEHHPDAVKAGRFDGVLVWWAKFRPA